MKEIIQTSEGPAPIGPYSQAVAAGDFLFISGQIALDPATGDLVNGSLVEETHRVMKNLSAILAGAGLGFSSVVKTTIFLRDMNSFSQVNEVYGSYFKDSFPARETVEVSGLPKDVRVEISMIALKAGK